MSRAAILSAVYGLLDGVGGARSRNAALPASVPDGGLVIMRDGEPGEPTVLLGRPRPIEIYRHAVKIEMFSDAADPETEIYGMADAIKDAVRADRTLGGLVEGVEIDAPTVDAIAAEDGAPTIAGEMVLRVHYVLEAA